MFLVRRAIAIVVVAVITTTAMAAIRLTTSPIRLAAYTITLKSYPLRFMVDDIQVRVTNLVAPVTEPQKPAGTSRKPARKARKKSMRFRISGDILFDFDKSEIRPEAEAVLADLADKIAKRSSNAEVRVEGHTDAKGSNEYNQALSERRAVAVKSWLSRKGKISVRRIATKGFGETRPVAPNQNPDGSDDPVGRQKNRRVEIIVSG